MNLKGFNVTAALRALPKINCWMRLLIDIGGRQCAFGDIHRQAMAFRQLARPAKFRDRGVDTRRIGDGGGAADALHSTGFRVAALTGDAVLGAAPTACVKPIPAPGAMVPTKLRRLRRSMRFTCYSSNGCPAGN